MGRASELTRRLKEIDYKLFCEKNMEGKLCVFREGTRLETYDLDGITLDVARPAPHFVLALTDNWKATGNPVNWGFMPIFQRLRSIDLWNRDMVKEIEEGQEAYEKTLDRDRRNKTEDFLREFRNDFKKTFNDVNTANLSKTKKQRLKEI